MRFYRSLLRQASQFQPVCNHEKSLLSARSMAAENPSAVAIFEQPTGSVGSLNINGASLQSLDLWTFSGHVKFKLSRRKKVKYETLPPQAIMLLSSPLRPGVKNGLPSAHHLQSYTMRKTQQLAKFQDRKNNECGVENTQQHFQGWKWNKIDIFHSPDVPTSKTPSPVQFPLRCSDCRSCQNVAQRASLDGVSWLELLKMTFLLS